jgi:hypothetical protein
LLYKRSQGFATLGVVDRGEEIIAFAVLMQSAEEAQSAGEVAERIESGRGQGGGGGGGGWLEAKRCGRLRWALTLLAPPLGVWPLPLPSV